MTLWEILITLVSVEMSAIFHFYHCLFCYHSHGSSHRDSCLHRKNHLCFSVMMVRHITVTLFTAVMSIHHIGMRIQSDFSLWWWCILAPLGAWRLLKSMIMWLNWWGKSWLIQMWRTKFPSIWHLSQNTVHLSKEKRKC